MRTNLKKEIRSLVVKILKDEKNSVPKTFERLARKVAEDLRTKDEKWKPTSAFEAHTFKSTPSEPLLNDDEEKVLLEIYWDLFREKNITLGREVTDFSIHSESKEFVMA